MVDGPPTESSPAIAKKVAADVALAADADGEPKRARNTAGRRAPCAAVLSTRIRSASNPPAQRGTGSPRSTSSVGGRRSVPGNALTPTIGARRWSMSAQRAAWVAATRRSTVPTSTARRKPPADSISWKTSQARSASCSVRRSTYHEPPAASITRVTFDSRASTAWVLRASRRPSSLGGAATNVSWGRTVMASAPPTAAAKQATVDRTMLTAAS